MPDLIIADLKLLRDPCEDRLDQSPDMRIGIEGKTVEVAVPALPRAKGDVEI
jgi:hypothetical protein